MQKLLLNKAKNTLVKAKWFERGKEREKCVCVCSRVYVQVLL